MPNKTSLTRHPTTRVARAVFQTLVLVTLVVFLGLTACGSDTPTNLPSPTFTTAPLSPQQLVVYAPGGGRLIYSRVERAMKARGLAYDVTILEGVTTELTVKGLKDGAFDMIFMRRSPHPDEGIGFFGLFRVTLAIYTHPDVSVDNLTSRQIASIFSGETMNWSEVGGKDQEIVLYVLPEFDSLTQALRAYAIGDRPFSPSAHRFPDETSVLLSATGVAGGIGYGSWATKKYLEMVSPDTKQLVFHTVSVDGKALDDPDYPLSIVLGFGYLPEREAFLRPLFEWITEFLSSDQGQQILGLFDVRPVEIQEDAVNDGH